MPFCVCAVAEQKADPRATRFEAVKKKCTHSRSASCWYYPYSVRAPMPKLPTLQICTNSKSVMFASCFKALSASVFEREHLLCLLPANTHEAFGGVPIKTVSACTGPHTHTHTHQMLIWCVCDMANDSSIAAIWGHMLHLTVEGYRGHKPCQHGDKLWSAWTEEGFIILVDKNSLRDLTRQPNRNKETDWFFSSFGCRKLRSFRPQRALHWGRESLIEVLSI